MKYCLNSRQPNEYLVKANEIKVAFRDRESIPDLADKYPNKHITLVHMPTDDVINWKEVKRWDVLTHSQLYLCLDTVENCLIAKENGVKFFMGFPASSWYELDALKDLGVSYVYLNAPLFFNMPSVQACEIPIRAVPNVAYADGFPRPDGVNGTWIRPEDVALYEKYIEVMEFADCDIPKEQALFRIYAEQKNWPGELNMLITNLQHEGLNRLINSITMEKRLTCGQHCAVPYGACHACYRALDLANNKLLQDYQEETTKETVN